MRTILALLVMACAFGCASEHLVPRHHRSPNGGPCDREYFVPANEFPEDERGALDFAVERWNKVALESFCLVDGGVHGDEHTISRVMVNSQEWVDVTKGFGSPYVIGVYYNPPDRIVVMSGLDPGTFDVVALHELGHAHGLEHVDPPAVMAPVVGSASDFTANDFTECRRVGACPLPLEADMLRSVYDTSNNCGLTLPPIYY